MAITESDTSVVQGVKQAAAAEREAERRSDLQRNTTRDEGGKFYARGGMGGMVYLRRMMIFGYGCRICALSSVHDRYEIGFI